MLRAPQLPLQFHEPWPGLAASDAKATDCEAIIGGWLCESSPVRKRDCRWFSIWLTKRRFPWIWQRENDPKRVISALEMLGLVFLMRLLGRAAPNAHAVLHVGGLTDNQGNAFALLKEYSRRLPTAAVHMELAATAGFHNIWPEISHVKRDDNAWADALTNEDFAGWDRHRRWEPVIDCGFFFIIDELLLGTNIMAAAGGVEPSCGLLQGRRKT